MLGEFVSVACELAENNPARQRTRIETAKKSDQEKGLSYRLFSSAITNVYNHRALEEETLLCL